jgi:hypothetical protein
MGIIIVKETICGSARAQKRFHPDEVTEGNFKSKARFALIEERLSAVFLTSEASIFLPILSFVTSVSLR